ACWLVPRSSLNTPPACWKPGLVTRGNQEPAGTSNVSAAGAGSISSVEDWQHPSDTPPIVGVPLAEPRLEQGLFGVHPCDQRRDQQERHQGADRAAEDQGPAEEAQEQAQVAGMADHAR